MNTVDEYVENMAILITEMKEMKRMKVEIKFREKKIEMLNKHCNNLRTIIFKMLSSTDVNLDEVDKILKGASLEELKRIMDPSKPVNDMRKEKTKVVIMDGDSFVKCMIKKMSSDIKDDAVREYDSN